METYCNGIRTNSCPWGMQRNQNLTYVLGSSSIWKCQISNICHCFLQAGAVEKNQNNGILLPKIVLVIEKNFQKF